MALHNNPNPSSIPSNIRAPTGTTVPPPKPGEDLAAWVNQHNQNIKAHYGISSTEFAPPAPPPTGLSYAQKANGSLGSQASAQNVSTATGEQLTDTAQLGNTPTTPVNLGGQLPHTAGNGEFMNVDFAYGNSNVTNNPIQSAQLSSAALTGNGPAASYNPAAGYGPPTMGTYRVMAGVSGPVKIGQD